MERFLKEDGDVWMRCWKEVCEVFAGAARSVVSEGATHLRSRADLCEKMGGVG